MTTRSKYIGGVLSFYEDQQYEHVLPVAPVQFYEDFLGEAYVAVPAVGSAVAGCYFVKKIVGSGPPTLAGVANAIGGQVACTLAATSEKEDCVLYWGDNLGLDCTKGLQFETRALLSVTPSATGVQAVWGVAGPWIDGPQNNTCYLEFSAQDCVRWRDDDITCERCDGRHDRLASVSHRRDKPRRRGVPHRRQPGQCGGHHQLRRHRHASRAPALLRCLQSERYGCCDADPRLRPSVDEPQVRP
jgi:hypothetical protein